ncbi:structural maintenance of chromosomes protein 1B isoform X1 [Synchiropus splendidus]|uniref:structural maintenance of chromosomes protein 1B isoform X1 n=1 Tax=Synchiropus splendidus TaxID=270530 RepID=UPI00237EDE03|nr:structural maintenance of chromosomes protein 1B isoform X1 [Synchiropus splendidus]
MGYLRQIVVENFKSWRGKRVLGPFEQFHCVIGTNGSGKSNVMDAISFVIGERAATLRVKHLRDLIHGAHVGRPVASSTRVCMHYRDNQDHETVFSRSHSEGSSEYYIDSVQVSFINYIGQLEEIGIFTKARNCLVFQGVVESIALKDPRDRTRMFEMISQSRECAALYDQKKQALLNAKEETNFHFKKKKAAVIEKMQVSKEKVEAEKYQEMTDDLQQKQFELTLAELYYNERDIKSTCSTLDEKQQETSTKMDIMTKCEQIVKDKKKEIGRLSREVQLREKEYCAQEHLLFQSRAQCIKMKTKTSHHMTKVEDARDTMKKCEKLLAFKRQELAEYKQEKVEVESAWQYYENQIQNQGDFQGRDIHLNEDQLQQYKVLKEFARKESAIHTQQADKLQWDLKTSTEKVAFDQHKKKEVKSAIRTKLAQLDELTARAEKLEDYTVTSQAAIEQYLEQEQMLSAELEQGRQRSIQLNQELGQVQEELGNARLEKQESKRQQRRKTLLEKLQRLYPECVYGRLYDVCSPIHKKYQLAVTKVFGHNLMAIVVTTEKVARDCISFIKEERGEPETFLPIDNLVVNPINERLREIPGAKLVMDVVQINIASATELMRVVLYVCGNALVCETIKEARRVAFDGRQRLKTVSLDGTLFTKSGMISGGSSYLRTKARCWDDKDMAQLKERKDEMVLELHELIRLKRKETDLNHIRVQAGGAQKRLKYAQNELENVQRKIIPQLQSDISRMKTDLSNLDAEILIHQKHIEEKNAEVTKMKEEISQIEDSVFSDFCHDIGVRSIGEYEKEHLKRQTEFDTKRLEFENQCTRLDVQWVYEQEQLEKQQGNLLRLQEMVEKEEEAVEMHRKEEAKLLEAVEKNEAELLEMKNGLLNKKDDLSLLKSDLSSKTRNLEELNKEVVKLQQEVMTSESALEQKHLARHNLLITCKVQGLPISIVAGSLDEISETQLPAGLDGSSASLSIYEREAQIIIDYSSLDAELKTANIEEVPAILESLKESNASLVEMLGQTSAPNLKAFQRMSEVNDKLQALNEDFESSTRKTRNCSQEFEHVKAQRLSLFCQCFDHVSAVLDQIYKRICRNNSAQATLSAEDADEPYLGGINFSCIAPGKRFMSMDNLSGGEKAIAALALVFALHSFRPGPFLFLDEVDAALDKSNIAKVTNFIREESRANLQIIVISLNEDFYSKADGLLGVYCHRDDATISHFLTMDLTPFPLDDDDEERETAAVEKVVDNIVSLNIF